MNSVFFFNKVYYAIRRFIGVYKLLDVSDFHYNKDCNAFLSDLIRNIDVSDFHYNKDCNNSDSLIY